LGFPPHQHANNPVSNAGPGDPERSKYFQEEGRFQIPIFGSDFNIPYYDLSGLQGYSVFPVFSGGGGVSYPGIPTIRQAVKPVRYFAREFECILEDFSRK
jgi:hypothetical protein